VSGQVVEEPRVASAQRPVDLESFGHRRDTGFPGEPELDPGIGNSGQQVAKDGGRLATFRVRPQPEVVRHVAEELGGMRSSTATECFKLGQEVAHVDRSLLTRGNASGDRVGAENSSGPLNCGFARAAVMVCWISGAVRSTRIILSLTRSAPRAGRATGEPKDRTVSGYSRLSRPVVRRGFGELRTDGRHRDETDHVLSTLHGSDSAARNACSACPDEFSAPTGRTETAAEFRQHREVINKHETR